MLDIKLFLAALKCADKLTLKLSIFGAKLKLVNILVCEVFVFYVHLVNGWARKHSKIKVILHMWTIRTFWIR